MNFMHKEYFTKLLKEDAPFGDITSENVIDSGTKSIGQVIASSNFILSGIEEAYDIFSIAGLHATPKMAAGDWVERGEVIMKVSGDARKILLCERLALNFIMRMSGVATKTAEYVRACRKVNDDIIIAATRKTTPGFSYFEKKAVMHGGGDPHRFNLSSGIIVKDNHFVVCGNASKVARRVSRSGFMQKIDIEVDNMEVLKQVLSCSPDVIMLDNMSPEEAEKAAKAIRKESPSTMVEVSGGINLENASDYASFADIISTSDMTMNPKKVDVSLDIVEVMRP